MLFYFRLTSVSCWLMLSSPIWSPGLQSCISLLHPQYAWHTQSSLPGRCFLYPSPMPVTPEIELLLHTCWITQCCFACLAFEWLSSETPLLPSTGGTAKYSRQEQRFGLVFKSSFPLHDFGKVLNFSMALQFVTYKVETIIAPTPVAVMRINWDN